MKILLAKNLEDLEISEISKVLGKKVQVDAKAFIQTEILEIDEEKSEYFSDHILVFTSPKGVEGFFKQHQILSEKRPQIWVVGSKTTASVNQYGCAVSHQFVNSEELAAFYSSTSVTLKLVHYCGDLAPAIFQNNKNYTQKVVYTTQLLYPQLTEKYHAVVFFSPSGVRSFAKFNFFDDLQIFAIGETTAKEIKKWTAADVCVSPKNNMDDLLQLIIHQNL